MSCLYFAMSPSHEMPAAVDGKVDAVDRSIREQEQGGVKDVRHCRQPAGWRLRSMSLEYGSRLRAPVRAVADDPWMDGIDPHPLQLHDQRPDQPGKGSVHRRNHRRSRIGLVLRAAT